jgi:hypothetical protein
MPVEILLPVCAWDLKAEIPRASRWQQRPSRLEVLE